MSDTQGDYIVPTHTYHHPPSALPARMAPSPSISVAQANAPMLASGLDFDYDAYYDNYCKDFKDANWDRSQIPPTVPTPNNPSFGPLLDGVPWPKQPSLIALTRERPPRGGKTKYDDPPPIGFHGEGDETDFIYGQAELTPWHQPEIMFKLHSPPEREAYANQKINIPYMRDQYGDIMYEKWPRMVDGVLEPARPLRYFAGVPANISTREDWRRIELWRRVHPHLEMIDIVMRMRPDYANRTHRGDRRVRNSLNMRCSRKIYPVYHMISWFGKGLEKNDKKGLMRKLIQAELTQDQIENNTTRGTTPGQIRMDEPDGPENRIEQPAKNYRHSTRKFQGRKEDPETLAETKIHRKRSAAEFEVDYEDSDSDQAVMTFKRARGRPFKSGARLIATAASKRPRRHEAQEAQENILPAIELPESNVDSLAHEEPLGVAGQQVRENQDASFSSDDTTFFDHAYATYPQQKIYTEPTVPYMEPTVPGHYNHFDPMSYNYNASYNANAFPGLPLPPMHLGTGLNYNLPSALTLEAPNFDLGCGGHWKVNQHDYVVLTNDPGFRGAPFMFQQDQNRHY